MGGVLLATGFVVAALVGAAAVLKVLRWPEFRRELAEYGLPRVFETPVAVLVPACEAVSVVAYAIPGTRSYGAAGLTLLLLVFSVVLAAMLGRGRRDVPCACFGRSTRPITWLLPVRNLALACVPLAVLVADAADAGASGAAPWLAAGLAAILGWLLFEYAGMNEALKEA